MSKQGTEETKETGNKFWLEAKIGDQKVSLNYRGTTEGGALRYTSEGEEPYAFYINPNSQVTSLFKIAKGEDGNTNKEVAKLFLKEGQKDGKDYFFLSGKDVTVNLHGNKEVVEARKADLRSMESNAKAAAEARKAEKAEKTEEPEQPKKKSPRP